MNDPINNAIRRGLARIVITASLALASAAFIVPMTSLAAPAPGAAQTVPAVFYRSVEVDGIKVFYGEAGPANAPQVLLLHGFGASSFMFRDLIPQLATRYHVIAPDLPGFGQTVVPPERKYAWRFESLANTVEAFTDAVKFDRYAVYVFDYGAPTGYRLALRHPERIAGTITSD